MPSASRIEAFRARAPSPSRGHRRLGGHALFEVRSPCWKRSYVSRSCLQVREVLLHQVKRIRQVPRLPDLDRRESRRPRRPRLEACRARRAGPERPSCGTSRAERPERRAEQGFAGASSEPVRATRPLRRGGGGAAAGATKAIAPRARASPLSRTRDVTAAKTVSAPVTSTAARSCRERPRTASAEPSARGWRA